MTDFETGDNDTFFTQWRIPAIVPYNFNIALSFAYVMDLEIQHFTDNVRYLFYLI